MSAQGQNFAAIAAAVGDHNGRCPNPVEAVQMHPHDVERMGWEEGDIVRGARLEASESVQPDRFRLVCAGEPQDAIDAVAEQPDLVSA